MLGVVPVIPHALLHLGEQWAALSGRTAWLERMRATSSGPLATLLELVVVVAYLAWLVLLVRGLASGVVVRGALRSESWLARAHASVERPAALITAGLAALHAAHLWLPRALGRASHLESYETLRTVTGTPLGIALTALGLTAFCAHVAASIPTALLVLGVGEARDTRQSVRLVSTGLSACVFVLAVQLAGWHATGTGTVWPIEVVAVPDGPPAPEE